LKPVKLGDSDQVRTGEFVVALGSPLTLNNTVTSGVVSNPLRDGTELGLTNDLFYIQTDTIVTVRKDFWDYLIMINIVNLNFIKHGNSGGPLVNLDGEVIGINSMTATPGISFAIPSKYASEFLDIRRASIASKYRYLGMKMISITPQINHLFNEHTGSDIKIPKNLYHGCLIIEVSPDSPAERFYFNLFLLRS
jgi:S1-C subfamily serine protease